MGLATDYASQDDATLIRLIAQAQAEALAQLYDRYSRLIFSIALAMVDDHDIAEEITLDVFVRVWQKAGTYRADQAKVSTWLTHITRHHTIDVLRRRGARPEQYNLSWDEITDGAALSSSDPQELVELSLRRARVRAAIAQLPADQKQALVLAYFRGYTQRQIAEALNQPLGTVKTRIRLAMQKLRDLLQDEQEPRDKSEEALAAYNISKDV